MDETTLEIELQQLQTKLWEKHEDWAHEGRRPIVWYTARGRLSKAEVYRILETAQQFNMPMVMHEVGFGFGHIGISIFSNEKCVGVAPEFLFELSEKHLDPKEFLWAEKATLGNVLDEAWALFSPFTHSEANRKRLEYSKFDMPCSRKSYCY